MKCKGDLNIHNHLKVGGKIAVDGDVNADSIRVGGKLEADKVVAQKYIETSILYTRNGATATRIEIERRGKVRGPLVGEIVTIKDRAEVEDIHADRIQLRRGCRAGNLYGRVIWIDTGCDVESVTYTEELRSDSSVRIRHGVLQNQIRSPFEALHLISEKDTTTSEYLPNPYWDTSFKDVRDDRRIAIQKLLIGFSQKLDDVAHKLNKEMI